MGVEIIPELCIPCIKTTKDRHIERKYIESILPHSKNTVHRARNWCLNSSFWFR